MFFKSIVIEGGDQIGKRDVARVLSQRLAKKDIPINKLSFPMYSSPFGCIVRKSLEEGYNDIKGLGNILGTKREMEIRAICFSLNRMEALESVLRTFNEREAYFLLDRSPYSIALTIAYGLKGQKSIKKKDVSDLVKKHLEFEKLFIKIFDTDKCVLHLCADYGKKKWEGARKDGDSYEIKEVQEVADDVYSDIKKFVGDGWRSIYTKIDGEFRDRSDIQEEVDDAIDSLSLKPRKGVKPLFYDIWEVARDIYGLDISDLSNYKLYMEYMEDESNAKNQERHEEAFNIGEYITKNCKEVTFLNGEVKEDFKYLLDLYPEVNVLLKHYYGNGFVDKLKKGVYG